MTNLVRKDSIEELVGHRHRALSLYRQVYELLGEAREAHERACVGNHHISSFAIGHERYFSPARTPDALKTLRRELDSDMWRALIVNSRLGSLMDKKERKSFEDGLQADPPEITAETVLATMQRLAGAADAIFRRGLVAAFQNLSRDYRSHDGFKIGSRIVLTHVISASNKWGGHCYFTTYSDETLRDVDRVMHILDGREPPEYQQGLCAAMRTAMQGQPRLWQTETEYFRARWFLNGNCHLWLLRPDLVELANKQIALHFGAAVGASPDVANKPAPPPPEAGKAEDFFATPPAAVQAILLAADIQPHHCVLEPQAGEGSIAVEVAKLVCPQQLACCEINLDRAAALRSKLGPDTLVQARDFLATDARPVYDRVVMNPPFSLRQAEHHVMHAAKFLAPGGRLVAVMPSGAHVRDDRIGRDFRRLLDQMNGETIPMAEGSFLASGTAVRTMLVVLNAQNGA